MADTYEVAAYLKETGVDQFIQQFKRAEASVSDFKSKFEKSINSIKSNQNIKALGSGIMNASDKVGAGLVKAAKIGLGGVTALVGGFSALAIASVKAAGEADVINAQYTQVFGDLEGEATKAVNGMSKEWNMLPNRLKPAMSTFDAFFLQTGKDGPKALAATTDAMALAADGAAFMDISMEDSVRALKSTMMGNYEAADALGVNINATKLATAYNEQYGGSWDDLNDSAKSDFLLEYIKRSYEASNVTGQATREANSLANVTANVKEGFKGILAAIGGPFLQPILDQAGKLTPLFGELSNKITAFFESAKGQEVIKTFTDTVGKLTDKFVAFIKNVDIQSLAEKFVAFGESLANGGIKDKLVSIKDGFQSFWDTISPMLPVLIDNLPQIVKALVAFATISPAIKAITGVAGAFKAFKGVYDILKILLPVLSGLATLITGTVIPAIIAFVTTFAIPIAVITAVIAVGVLLYKNWDTICQWAGTLGAKVKEVFLAMIEWAGEMASGVVQWFNDMKAKASDAISNMVSTVVNWFNDMKAKITDKVMQVVNSVVQWFNDMKEKASNAIRNMKNAVVNYFINLASDVKNKVNDMKNNIVNGFNNAKSKAIEIATNIKNKVVNTFTNLVTGAKNAVGKLKGAVGDAMRGAYNTVKDWFNTFKNAGSNLVGMVADGISGAIGKVTGAIGKVTSAIRDFLPFSPAKRGALHDLDKLNFGGTISTGIYKGERQITRAMDSILTIPDLNVPTLNTRSVLNGMNQNAVMNAENKFDVTVVSQLNGREIARGTQKDMTIEQQRQERYAARLSGYRRYQS